MSDSPAAAAPLDFPRSRFQIGSIHGRLNFTQYSQAFHHSDIPEREILDYKKRDILQLSKPALNLSSQYPPPAPCERIACRIPERDVQWFEYDYRASSLGKRGTYYHPIPDKFEMDSTVLLPSSEQKAVSRLPQVPTTLCNNDWNRSTLIDPKEQRLCFTAKESLRSTYHQKYQEKYLSATYTNPEKLFTTRRRLEKQGVLPVAAMAPDPEDPDPECTFRPQYVTPVPRRLTTRFRHTGSFIPAADGVPRWSCCLQESADARGCEKSVRDWDALNVASV